jgi:hypothetical protein
MDRWAAAGGLAVLGLVAAVFLLEGDETPPPPASPTPLSSPGATPIVPPPAPPPARPDDAPDAPEAATAEESSEPPGPPAATATLVLPKGVPEETVKVFVRPLSSDGEARRVVPAKAGALRLDTLPEGRYVLEVTAILDGAVVSTKREFHHYGGTTKIGRIEFVIWAGIKARVVDADGKPVLQARVTICREEEDEKRSRTAPADEHGWVTFRDFEPGAWHRVSAFDLPGPLEKLVLAPEKRKEVRRVELRWPGQLVDCRLTFPIPVKERIMPGPIPWRESNFVSDTTLAVGLLPGSYEFRVATDSVVKRRFVIVVPAVRKLEAAVGLVSKEK